MKTPITIVAISPRGWGKGKTLMQALENLAKGAYESKGSMLTELNRNRVTVYVTDSKEIEVDEFGVRVFGDCFLANLGNAKSESYFKTTDEQ